jgi:hypothetical protein
MKPAKRWVSACLVATATLLGACLDPSQSSQPESDRVQLKVRIETITPDADTTVEYGTAVLLKCRERPLCG